MSLRLKNTTASQFCRDGWPFTDPKTGMRFGGMEGSPPMQAVRIAAHRAANPRLYPAGEGQDTNAIIQEIYAQKVQVMPELFVGYPDKNPAYPSQPAQRETIVKGAACSCGGTEFIAEYCRTCSGNRIIGRKCKSCGKAA